MDTIITKLNEYEKDIELLKNAILVLDKNFKSIKTEILKTYTSENISNKKVKEKAIAREKRKEKEKKKGKEKKNKTKVGKKKENNTTIFKKSSIQLSSNIKNFFFDSDKEDSNNTFLVSELNNKINAYLIEKDLIKNNKIYLNKELKNILNTKKRVIGLDEILNIIIIINNTN